MRSREERSVPAREFPVELQPKPLASASSHLRAVNDAVSTGIQRSEDCAKVAAPVLSSFSRFAADRAPELSPCRYEQLDIVLQRSPRRLKRRSIISSIILRLMLCANNGGVDGLDELDALTAELVLHVHPSLLPLPPQSLANNRERSCEPPLANARLDHCRRTRRDRSLPSVTVPPPYPKPPTQRTLKNTRALVSLTRRFRHSLIMRSTFLEPLLQPALLFLDSLRLRGLLLSLSLALALLPRHDERRFLGRKRGRSCGRSRIVEHTGADSARGLRRRRIAVDHQGKRRSWGWHLMCFSLAAIVTSHSDGLATSLAQVLVRLDHQRQLVALLL